MVVDIKIDGGQIEAVLLLEGILLRKFCVLTG